MGQTSERMFRTGWRALAVATLVAGCIGFILGSLVARTDRGREAGDASRRGESSALADYGDERRNGSVTLTEGEVLERDIHGGRSGVKDSEGGGASRTSMSAEIGGRRHASTVPPMAQDCLEALADHDSARAKQLRTLIFIELADARRDELRANWVKLMGGVPYDEDEAGPLVDLYGALSRQRNPAELQQLMSALSHGAEDVMEASARLSEALRLSEGRDTENVVELRRQLRRAERLMFGAAEPHLEPTERRFMLALSCSEAYSTRFGFESASEVLLWDRRNALGREQPDERLLKLGSLEYFDRISECLRLERHPSEIGKLFLAFERGYREWVESGGERGSEETRMLKGLRGLLDEGEWSRVSRLSMRAGGSD